MSRNFFFRSEFAGIGGYSLSAEVRRNGKTRVWYFSPDPIYQGLQYGLREFELANTERLLAVLRGLSGERKQIGPDVSNVLRWGGGGGEKKCENMVYDEFADLLFSFHRRVAEGGDLAPGPVGTFRNQRNIIRGGKHNVYNTVHASPYHEEIPGLIGQVLTFVQNSPAMTFLEKAIVANCYILIIQPFIDGNGRTAGLLMEKLLVDGGLLDSAGLCLRSGVERHFRQLQTALHNVVKWGDWSCYVRSMISALNAAAEIEIGMRQTESIVCRRLRT